MSLLLDTKTILVAIGLGHLFTSILIGAYWYGHPKNKLMYIFLLGKCTESVAWLGSALRLEQPSMFYLLFINSMLFIGAACEILALLSLQNEQRPRTQRIYVYLTVVSIIGYLLLQLYYDKESVRVAYVSIITSLMLLPVYRMIIGRSATLLMKIMGSLYLLVIAMSMFRGTVALLSGERITTFTPGIYQTIMVLAIFLLMILENSGFVLLLKEKTDQELIRLASFDDLTNTLNRRTFAESADLCLAENAKKGRPISFLLFDIDNFKLINDTFGHVVGDQVLQDMTSRIKIHLDKEDLFVRYGGDEFGLMVSGKGESASNQLVEKIKESLHGATSRGLPVQYTISIGILTVLPDQHTELNALYSNCDKALYTAKNTGRNDVYRG